MLKLIKYLKKSVLPIIAIVMLLVVQAVCDLSLPDFTSKIVNVGIQQGGVEDAVPSVIRKSEMDKIFLFMDASEKQKVVDNYILLDKDSLTESELDSYKKDYPVVANEVLYKLNTTDKDVRADLNSIFAKPILIVSRLEEDTEESRAMKAQMMQNMPKEAVASGDIDIFKVFASMPEQELAQIRTEMKAKFEVMPETVITQSAVAYVKAEYQSIGINTDSTQSKYILTAGGKMLLLAIVSMIATVLVGLLGARVAASLGKDLRGRVFRKVMSFSSTEMDKFSTASLITRTTNDIQQVQTLMVMLLRVVFYAPILGIGGIIKVLGTNTSMAWIIAVAVMAILSLVIVMFAVVMPKFKIVQTLVDKLNLVTREILTGLSVIRAFSTERYEEKRFDKANKNLTDTNLFVNRIMACMMPAMMLIMNAITVLIVWRGAYNVDAGTMQVGDMMAFIQYTMQIIMAFLMITMVSVMLPRALVSVGRIDEVLTTDLIINDPKKVEAFDTDSKGVLEFKNVSFRYPNAEEDVLSNITFTAKPGETTAFIGSTGSGKSTLVNLIPRFYDVTEGEIIIDGRDIRTVSQHDLRDKIGYVPQKGVLFSGTIDSNLRYGKEDATEAEIARAASIAQATDFIESKEEGFNSDISQGGTNVSGGQKQRLSIARAIAKDPELYIFDDSFSALDFKTDATLRKALKAETGKSTVLIVAQRISTILHAEQILVLDEGRIVGKGTHKELLENCEVYKQIALSQLSKEELGNE